MFEGYSGPEVGVNHLFRGASAKATFGGGRTSSLESSGSLLYDVGRTRFVHVPCGQQRT